MICRLILSKAKKLIPLPSPPYAQILFDFFDYLINFGAIEDRVNGGRLGGGGISGRGKINNKIIKRIKPFDFFDFLIYFSFFKSSHNRNRIISICVHND